MAHATAAPASHALAEHITPAATTGIQHPPVTPGKVAMWLFLATEVMFFTGLIGSYIVLRAGSPPTAYSNLFSPATDLTLLENRKGVHLIEAGPNPSRVVEIVKSAGGITDEHHAEHLVHQAHRGWFELVKSEGVGVVYGVTDAKAKQIVAELEEAGAKAEIEPLKTYKWPLPYDTDTNPLSIDLTAANTFVLICSSVTMVLALSAIQRGDRRRLTLFLLATVLIGSCFLSVQVFEYYQLMKGHSYPPGISANSHFRPNVSLFASCFFVMTGFHGMHVFGGVVMLTCILIQSLRGAYTPLHYSPVELIGLYWHFVDLVWIILFTVVYLI